MRNRLPIALSLAAVVIAILGATPAGEAAKRLVLPGKAVGSKHLKLRAVKRVHVATGAIGTEQLADGAIQAVDLAPGVAVSGPKGETGATGATGPSDAFSAFKDATTLAFAGDTTVVTLPIPQAGKYVLFAKAVAQRNGAAGTADGVCRLTAGSAVDQAGFNLAPIGSAGDREALALNTVAEYAAPGTATLVCTNPAGQNVDVQFARVTAIRVGTLVNAASA